MRKFEAAVICYSIGQPYPRREEQQIRHNNNTYLTRERLEPRKHHATTVTKKNYT
jgi:hypothetical protein